MKSLKLGDYIPDFSLKDQETQRHADEALKTCVTLHGNYH